MQLNGDEYFSPVFPYSSSGVLAIAHRQARADKETDARTTHTHTHTHTYIRIHTHTT